MSWLTKHNFKHQKSYQKIFLQIKINDFFSVCCLDRLWLHIRTTGNWTSDLYKYLSKYDPGEDSERIEPVSPMVTVLQQKRKKMDKNSRRKSIIGRFFQ